MNCIFVPKSSCWIFFHFFLKNYQNTFINIFNLIKKGIHFAFFIKNLYDFKSYHIWCQLIYLYVFTPKKTKFQFSMSSRHSVCWASKIWREIIEIFNRVPFLLSKKTFLQSWFFSRQIFFWYFGKGKSFWAKRNLAGKKSTLQKSFLTLQKPFSHKLSNRKFFQFSGEKNFKHVLNFSKWLIKKRELNLSHLFSKSFGSFEVSRTILVCFSIVYHMIC